MGLSANGYRSATSIALDRQRSLFTNLEVDNTLPILRAFPFPEP